MTPSYCHIISPVQKYSEHAVELDVRQAARLTTRSSRLLNPEKAESWDFEGSGT